MDFLIKSIILLLVLLKTVDCQDCKFSYDPNDNCDLSILCEGTSDIANIAASRRYHESCQSWRRRATFSHVTLFTCFYDSNPSAFNLDMYHLITCSSCENSVVFESFIEFVIIDSDCSFYSLPKFDKFPNVEVIRMHNANLEEVSIESQHLRKLGFLDLSQNKISHINTSRLHTQSHLRIFNVSFNIINTLKDEGFRYLSSLEQLDLTSNRIERITPKTFYGLHNLTFLSLSHNKISDINSAFYESLISLEEIYLDNNRLQEINKDTFKGLENLKILKLNSNYINVIDWAVMEHIPMLKIFDISNNGIKKISKTAFANNNYINYVDFSFNNITQLIPKTFLNKNITFFSMKNNLLEGGLEFGMFKGMAMVSELDLSHQHITVVGDDDFYGLNRLTTLLLNDNSIQNISKKAFKSLGDLELLDLSNNMLHYIDFEINELNKLKILRLRNNLIEDIGSNIEMDTLEILDLSHNNLAHFNSGMYDPILPRLKKLNISHNSIKIIQDDLFDKFLYLSSVDFSDNRNLTIAYNLEKNTSIERHVDIPHAFELKSVSISNCDMDSVTFLKFNTYGNITSLDLCHNQILKIEYGMFSSNKKLMRLDLSHNKISHIQPGSFKDNNELRELNVAHNELLELEYGSFRGLKQLNFLDMSFNKIESLKNGRFFEISNLNTLIADNNSIASVDYEDFAGANITTLSIGGNPIPCMLLINLKSETHSLQVTTLKEELHSTNFKGISCSADNERINKDNMYLERRDALLEDIRNILLEIKSADYSKTSDPGSKSGNELQKKDFYRNEANTETSVAKPMQPSQTIFSILSDLSIIFVAVVILCLMLYKVYEQNLFTSLRRRRSASTRFINESIETATI